MWDQSDKLIEKGNIPQPAKKSIEEWTEQEVASRAKEAEARAAAQAAPVVANETQSQVAKRRESLDDERADLEAIALDIVSGAPRIGENIKQIIDGYPSIRRRSVANAVLALGATRWRMDTKTKEHIVEPDHQLRFKALEFLADRADGRPPESVYNYNVNATVDGPSKKDPSSWSPAMREEMRRQLDEADRAAKKKREAE